MGATPARAIRIVPPLRTAATPTSGKAHFLRSIALRYVDASGAGTSRSRISSSGASVVVLRSSSVGSLYTSATGSSLRLVRTVAPSATSAAATSDGCADAHWSFPKIACSRCAPSLATPRPPPWSQQSNPRRQYQQRVACSRLPPLAPIERSCGDAASEQASRSACGICGSTSSSARVVPAPMRVPSIPRGTAVETWTSVSARTRPSRRSGTSSVPPARTTEPLPSAAVASSALDGRRSSTPLLLPLGGLAQRAQHLLAADRQRADVRSGRVADRIRDRGRCRDDRRLAQALRAKVRQVRIRDVDQLRHDLGHVGDRGHLVGVERAGEDRARRRVDDPLLGQRVADALDDAALDLARCAELVDHATDVVDRDDLVGAHLAGLDIDGDFRDLHAERQYLHARG